MIEITKYLTVTSAFFVFYGNCERIIVLSTINRLGDYNPASHLMENSVWLWSRYTSESLDHTAQLGFHPPDILLICQPLLIPKVARSQYNPKPVKLSLSPLIHVSSLQYLLLLLTPSLCRTHPALLLLLTQGSVLSSVPVEGGCSPASVGWEWTQCHSPLSPGVQSTSHCCISEKQNEKSLSDKIPEFKLVLKSNPL